MEAIHMKSITRIITKGCLPALLVAVSVTAALAHGGFEHVQGTVSKISAQTVTVTTAAKKSVEVGINAKTTYTRGDKTVAASDMKVGDRVVIDATEVNEALVAASVKLGAAAAPAAQKTTK
jgi:hypothetical protein